MTSTNARTRRAVEMNRLVTKMALGLPVPVAAMLPRVVTAAPPSGSAEYSCKPTPEPRCTVTVAGYYRLVVPRGT
jgi:hypothetical protein